MIGVYKTPGDWYNSNQTSYVFVIWIKLILNSDRRLQGRCGEDNGYHHELCKKLYKFWNILIGMELPLLAIPWLLLDNKVIVCLMLTPLWSIRHRHSFFLVAIFNDTVLQFHIIALNAMKNINAHDDWNLNPAQRDWEASALPPLLSRRQCFRWKS